jgi:acyl-CoA thioesterase FadM
MGLVFYPTYFAWFDHATHRLFASSGRTLLTWLHEDGISVPIAECGARFQAPVFPADELTVTSAAVDVAARRFRVEHVIERDGELVASGFEKRVVARLGESNRLEVTPLPDDLRAWLAGDDDSST